MFRFLFPGLAARHSEYPRSAGGAAGANVPASGTAATARSAKHTTAPDDFSTSGLRQDYGVHS